MKKVKLYNLKYEKLEILEYLRNQEISANLAKILQGDQRELRFFFLLKLYLKYKKSVKKYISGHLWVWTFEKKYMSILQTTFRKGCKH